MALLFLALPFQDYTRPEPVCRLRAGLLRVAPIAEHAEKLEGLYIEMLRETWGCFVWGYYAA